VKIHALKTWSCYFDDVAAGRKRYEIRYDDRDFSIGDVVVLVETPTGSETITRRIAVVRITSILRGFDGLTPGFIAFSFDPVSVQVV